MTKAEARQLKRIQSTGTACAVNLAAFLKAKAPRRKPKSPRKIEKEQERLLKKGRWAEVKNAVFMRALGYCEACSAHTALDPDHFHGKRSETFETVWAICRLCHRNKTENLPSREWWDNRFHVHCQKYGHPFRKRFTKTIARHPQQEEATSDMESAGRGLAGTSTESK